MKTTSFSLHSLNSLILYRLGLALARSLMPEPNEPPRANSPNLYLNNAISTAGNYLDYPEELALYPSSRVSHTPSVSGFEGPETTRVFDVFEDNRVRKKVTGSITNPPVQTEHSIMILLSSPTSPQSFH
jgi:hypothetical protein